MPEIPDQDQFADDDPDYARDALDDATVRDEFPEPTDPATIPPDEVDTDAPHKHEAVSE